MSKRICVFCGSRPGVEPAYLAAAQAFGARLGAASGELIYGGGHIGLMGALADATIAAGGRVVGFIPTRLLEREVGHRDIDDLVVTDGMFDRKQKMIERADAFAVLPGGLGTLDELLEVVTLRQLGYHDKPVILIDVGGFWEPLIALVEHVVAKAFAGDDARSLLEVEEGVDAAADRLGLVLPRPEAAVLRTGMTAG